MAVREEQQNHLLKFNRTTFGISSQQSMPPGKPHSGTAHRRNNVVMFAVVAVVVLSILFFPSGPSKIPSVPKFKYAMMFDGGSSGSRVHVYRFKVLPNDALEVENEVFEQLKPGLSHYKDDPVAAAASLQPLLDVAKAHIPQSAWRCTPVALYATAGLRLLGKEVSDSILDEVRKLLRSSPFVLPSDDSVAVIDGSREGLFGWMTVNYLLKHWPSGDESSSAALIDLGGASTQIVFKPRGRDADLALAAASKEFTASVAVDGDRNVIIYQHSHLGFGLNEANRQIREAGLSDCGDFDKCRDAARTVLLPDGHECKHEVGCSIHGVFMPKLKKYFHRGDVYAISYVHDRLEPWLPAGEQPHISLGRIKELAKTKVCPNDPSIYKSDVSGGNPQHCLDLAYIYALMRDAYDMDDVSEVIIAKKIHGYETAWCLGAAIALTTSFRAAGTCSHA